MEAAVVADSREITREVVSMTRLSGSGKTNNAPHHPHHHHHQHHPHLQKPRVPPKHAGLTKNGLSQDPLVIKASSKESMKESSVALTRLLCGEDGERSEGRGGGEVAGNKSKHHHHHPLLDEATVGGSFSETVSRSPIWGHQTSKVHDSSVTRSRSFSCGNKANVSPAPHNRKREGDQEKEGAENETVTNKGKVSRKAETTLDGKHQQHQTLDKAPVKNMSVRQQWMAKRRSLSNSPKVGAASQPREHRKSQAVLSELVPVEATCAEVLPLTSGMRVGRKKLSVGKDEPRHTGKPHSDEGKDVRQAPDNKGSVSSAAANSECALSKDTSQEKAFTESDDCEQVTIISGNLKGSQKGKVVYVDRRHMQSSFSSSLGETVVAGPTAGSADSSVPSRREPVACGAQSGISSAQISDCAMGCKESSGGDIATLVKQTDEVRKRSDTGTSKQSTVVLEENLPSAKTLAHASKKNNTAISVSREDARSVSVSGNTKKDSNNKVVPLQKEVCDTEAGHSAVTVKEDIVKINVCDSEIVKAKTVVCEKQKQVSVAGLLNDSRQNTELAVVLTETGIKAFTDRVVVKSPTAAPRTKLQNIVAEVHISDGKVSSDVNNVNSIEMKTFRESSKDSKAKPVSVVAASVRSSDKADVKASVGSSTVVATTTSTTTVTVSNASTKTHTATTASVTSTITSISTTNSSSCQASLKPASSSISSSSGSEREKVFANEDSLPNSPQNVPEEGTTPTDNIEITDLDFFKTDIVRSSHCKRNSFSTALGPSNSPKQVREVAVATTPMRDLVELTGLDRPPPPPTGRGGARNACVTIVEVHHQPPAKKHTVDIVPASNARSLDGASSSVSSASTNACSTATATANSGNHNHSSLSHKNSPRGHAWPMRETSSSSSSRDSSPEKKGDLAVALTSSQDEKNRARDLVATATVQQEEAGKAKAKVKEATEASVQDRKIASKDLAAAVTSSQDEKNRTMAAVASSSSTSASTSCSSSQNEKKSRGEPILKPKARTKPAKSVSFNNKDVFATETPDNGFQFQLGILKECEVQVQAFLEDTDSVLEALDQCQAEEKCLMLIKRPRESAKKMLKSQSWANLSVSDPQLYRQFNGLQVAQVHQPIAQPASIKIQDKRAPNEPSMMPSREEEEEEGELPEQQSRRRYVSHRDRVSAKPQHQRLSLPADGPLLHGVTGDCSFGSDSFSSSSCSTASSDYQYNPPRRERRLELRYPSIPEDEVQEINNNKGFGAVAGAGDWHSSRPAPPSGSSSSGSSMYHSCHDVSFASQASSGVRSQRSCAQGHGDQAQGRQYSQQAPQRSGVAVRGSGTLGNLPSQQAAYNRYQQPQQPKSKSHAHDPGELDEESRSQSLGNLSTGELTLSLVGQQRRADSMVDLASPTSPPPPASATQLRPHRPAPRSHRSESYQQDFFPSQYPAHPGQATVGSPRHSCPEPHNVCTPRVRGDLKAYASPPPSGEGGGGGGHCGPGGAVQPSPARQQTRPQPQHGAGNFPSYAGGMPRSQHHHHQQQQKQLPTQHQPAPCLRNGYGDVRGETGFSNGSAPPPKPKRNLPNVSLNETSEKIKRFTEMMKSRMSVSSTSSRSSATPQTPTTPLSRQPSVTTDNGSDCEVSNLLDSGLGAGDAGGLGFGPGLPNRPYNPAGASQDGKALGEQMLARGHVGLPLTHPPSLMGPHYPPLQQPCSSASYSSSALSEVGGAVSFTSHSHSSTLDSGYTTNNECEADPCLSGYPHNPHQKMLSPPNLHQPPKVLLSRPPQQHVHLQQHHPPHQAQQQYYPVQPYQPQGQPAEALRPVPQPRNLNLANARKYSSMQNVHSRPQDIPPPDLHNAENNGETGPRNLSYGKEHSATRTQHFVNGYDSSADHGHHPAVLEHQRRSWDLAQSFKSLDFVPASSGPASIDSKSAAAMVEAVKGREDTAVVKPLPVSGNSSSSGNNSNSSSGGSHPCSSAGSSPAHRPDAQRRDTQPRTQRRSSWQEMVRANEAGDGGEKGSSESPPPPLPALPPPALEAGGVSTLPGHWKSNSSSNNNTSSNINNNSRPSAVNLSAGSSSSNSGGSSGASSSGPSTPQRTPLRLASIDTGSGSSAVGCTSPTPSLFQLSQLYDMRSLRFRTLAPSATLAQVLTLTAVPVSLPAGGLDAAASPPAHSPQGRTAKLGGPGSAFRKVASTGAGAGGQGVVLELTAVAAVLDPSPELWTLGPPLVGDLIVEINGRQCMGWEVARIQESLSATQGDILMGVARKREQPTDGRVQQLEISLKSLEEEVQKMKEELARKDARILELSTMLPWKRDEEESKDGKMLLEQEEGVFVIGENEFVV